MRLAEFVARLCQDGFEVEPGEIMTAMRQGHVARPPINHALELEFGSIHFQQVRVYLAKGKQPSPPTTAPRAGRLPGAAQLHSAFTQSIDGRDQPPPQSQTTP